MKKSIKLLGLIFLSTSVLAGCSKSETAPTSSAGLTVSDLAESKEETVWLKPQSNELVQEDSVIANVVFTKDGKAKVYTDFSNSIKDFSKKTNDEIMVLAEKSEEESFNNQRKTHIENIQRYIEQSEKQIKALTDNPFVESEQEFKEKTQVEKDVISKANDTIKKMNDLKYTPMSYTELAGVDISKDSSGKNVAGETLTFYANPILVDLDTIYYEFLDWQNDSKTEHQLPEKQKIDLGNMMTPITINETDYIQSLSDGSTTLIKTNDTLKSTTELKLNNK